MKKYDIKLLYIICSMLLLTLSLNAAELSKVIPFSGYLTDTAEKPLNGDYRITFTIYDDGPAWSETQMVKLTEGEFSVELGQVTPLDMDFSIQKLLGITIGDDEELSPRIPMLLVTNALQAEDVSNRDIHPNSVSTRYVYSGSIEATAVNATSLQINGTEVIDSTGAYKGEITETDPSVPAELQDGLNWQDIALIPADIADGDDTGLMVESDPSVPANLKDGASWTDIAGIPQKLVDGAVRWSELDGIPADIADGDDGITEESDPTVPASIKDGITFGEVMGIPSDIADGDDIGLTVESDPSVPAYLKDGLSWEEVLDKPVEPNNAPHINSVIADSIVAVPAQDITLTVHAMDDDGDALSYQWEATGGELKTNNAMSVIWDAPGEEGSYTMSVSVNDGTDIVTGTVSVIVSRELYDKIIVKKVTDETGETASNFMYPIVYKDILYFGGEPTSPMLGYDGRKYITIVNNSQTYTSGFFSPIIYKDILYFAGSNKMIYAYDGMSIKEIAITGTTDYINIFNFPIVFKDHLYFQGYNGGDYKAYRFDGKTISNLPAGNSGYISYFINPKLIYYNLYLIFTGIEATSGKKRMFFYNGTTTTLVSAKGTLPDVRKTYFSKEREWFYISSNDGNIYFMSGLSIDSIDKGTSGYAGGFDYPVFDKYSGTLYFGGRDTNGDYAIFKVKQFKIEYHSEGMLWTSGLKGDTIFLGKYTYSDRKYHITKIVNSEESEIEYDFDPARLAPTTDPENYKGRTIFRGVLNGQRHYFEYDEGLFKIIECDAGDRVGYFHFPTHYKGKLYFGGQDDNTGLNGMYVIE